MLAHTGMGPIRTCEANDGFGAWGLAGSNFVAQLRAAARFPDWETCGKAMHAMSTDAEYQSILAEAHQVGELHGRSIVVSLDL